MRLKAINAYTKPLEQESSKRKPRFTLRLRVIFMTCAENSSIPHNISDARIHQPLTCLPKITPLH